MSTPDFPILNAVELRVLGALIEKSKTTPDYYPMTLNALTAACNQKTSRSPVVDYDEETVGNAINSLKGLSLVSTAVGGGSRVIKYKHNFQTVFDISPEELTILCLLMLRGPQTPGELNTHSARLYHFKSLDEVLSVLNKLMNPSPPFITELAKKPGQKERRFAHLLGGEIIDEDVEVSEEGASKNVSNVESRLTTVERELAEVKESLAKLIRDLNA